MKRLIAGPRAVEEALRGHPQQLTVVYYASDATRALKSVLDVAQRQRVRAEPRERAELDTMAGALRHQGVLAIGGEYSYVGLEELLATEDVCPLFVALDQIQDPHNFGAIVRSAVAMGASGVITLKDRAAPVTPVTVRASAGATEQAKIARVTNMARTLSDLSQQGFQIVGLAGEGDALLSDIEVPAAGRVLVVGSEGSGLRPLVRKHCDILARIELPGPISSLNASVAAGIAIYESCRRRTGGLASDGQEHSEDGAQSRQGTEA